MLLLYMLFGTAINANRIPEIWLGEKPARNLGGEAHESRPSQTTIRTLCSFINYIGSLGIITLIGRADPLPPNASAQMRMFCE